MKLNLLSLDAPHVYWRNYDDPYNIYKGRNGNIVSTDKDMAPVLGNSLIINTSYEKDDKNPQTRWNHIAQVGILMGYATPEKALETFGPDSKQLVFVVDWTSDIVQISYDFMAMQGGEIAKKYRHRLVEDIIFGLTGIRVALTNFDEVDS